MHSYHQMPFFSYRALDAAGRTETGRIEALSGSDAYRKLRVRGLQPAKVTSEEGSVSAGREKKTTFAPMTGGGGGQLQKLGSQHLLFFTEELAELLDAGLQLEGALKVIEERQERSPVKLVAATLRQQVREGVGLS